MSQQPLGLHRSTPPTLAIQTAVLLYPSLLLSSLIFPAPARPSKPARNIPRPALATPANPVAQPEQVFPPPLIPRSPFVAAPQFASQIPQRRAHLPCSPRSAIKRSPDPCGCPNHRKHGSGAAHRDSCRAGPRHPSKLPRRNSARTPRCLCPRHIRFGQGLGHRLETLRVGRSLVASLGVRVQAIETLMGFCDRPFSPINFARRRAPKRPHPVD